MYFVAKKLSYWLLLNFETVLKWGNDIAYTLWCLEGQYIPACRRIVVWICLCLIVELLAGRPEEIYHVTVMPCYDKKLEAARDDFVFQVEYQGETPMNTSINVTEVDSVLTSGEVLDLIQVREDCL